MEILLLGKNGQLGWELQRALAPLGHILALGSEDLDLQKIEEVRGAIQKARPQILINAAAYTAVDTAESDADRAFTINSRLPGILAEEVESLHAVLIHFSTDYVFDGTKGSPYIEEDAPKPVNVYGASKLEGEKAIKAVGGSFLIFRTSWVYSLRRDSFVTKVLHWARNNQQIRIVDDQIGCPTWSRALAETTAMLLARAGTSPLPWLAARSGIYHLAGDGYASRRVWAQKTLELDPHREEQICQQVLPASSSEFPTPAKRPLFSALSCAKFANTFELKLNPWDEALRLALMAS